MICANCNQTIYIKHGHHRSCDGDVCSERCALARVNYISSFDPEFKSPLEWNDLKKKKNRTTEKSHRTLTFVEECEPQHNSPPTLMTVVLVVFMLRVIFA